MLKEMKSQIFKRRILILYISSLFISINLLLGCSKNDNTVPSAKETTNGFSFVNKTGDVILDSIKWPTSISAKIQNNDDTSLYRFKWDIGNGISDYTYTPSILYNTAGVYTIKRYAYGKANNEFIDSTMRVIVIKDRTLKSISLDHLDWTNILLTNDIPNNAIIDIFLRVYKPTDNSSSEYIFNNGEIVVQSDTLNNIKNNSNNLTIPLNTTKSYPLNSNNGGRYNHGLYGLYEGKVYLLAADWLSGVGGNFNDYFQLGVNSYMITTYTFSSGSGDMTLNGFFDFTDQ